MTDRHVDVGAVIIVDDRRIALGGAVLVVSPRRPYRSGVARRGQSP